ncbi:MAG TPA: glycosyltransferase [Caulobacteraceae bacterium]|nr:glycosyltransferase [Caulobacteraceae bacterium]
MIVRNEERFLGAALASLRDAVDEICIVDTGSTDGTLAIAESFGARVTAAVWRDDFAWARNQALAMARHAWIFVLDADEELLAQSRPALAELRRTRPDGKGRWIRCHNLTDDIRGDGAASNAIVRIFPNDPKIRYRGAIHEYVAREGEPYALHGVMSPVEIVHRGYLGEILAARGKGERNLRVSRAAYEADPTDPAHVYNYATSLMLAGEDVEARKLFELACAMTEDKPRGFRPAAFLMLAKLQMTAGEPETALRSVDRCIAIAPTLSDAHFLRGKLLADRVPSDAEGARAAFRAAIDAGRYASQQFVVDDEIANWKAANEIAAGLMREERYAEALPWLDAALTNRPAVQPMLFNQARCREMLGDINGALVGYAAAFEVFRDEPSAITYLNFVLRHAGPDVCLAATETVLPVVGDEYRCAFLTSAAAMMHRAGRRAEAADLVARALAIGDPAVARSTVTAMAEHFGEPGLLRPVPGLPEQPTVLGAAR